MATRPVSLFADRRSPASSRTIAPPPAAAGEPPRGHAQFFLAARAYLESQPTILLAARRLRFFALMGPHNAALVARYRSRNPPITTSDAAFFPGLDAASTARTLAELGYARGITIGAEVADRIVAEAGRETFIGPHRSCPTVRDLAHSERVVAVARHYLGAEPCLYESYVVWTPPSHHDYKNTFHYDVADARALSLFVYLTDVDHASSPHQVVAGTHGPKALRDLWTPQVPDTEIPRRFGDRVDTLTGPRGTAFFEDQTIVHRVLGGATRARGALVITYTLRRRSAYG
jgi:hypothetical protein